MKYYCAQNQDDIFDAMDEYNWKYNRTKKVAQRRAKVKKMNHRKARRTAKIEID